MADYNLGTASGRIVVDGSGAELGFNVARTAANAFFDVVKMRVDQVQSLGRKMAAVGATGVTAFGVSVKVAADFEKQMSGVYAVANANEEQMERLRQKALDLGKDTVFSASEAAQALEELVKAGISVEDVLNGGADAATALAAAGGVSIPEAATIAANAMNAFALSGEEVGNIADILAGVANTSAADVSGLGQSLAQAGAVANLAGLDFKDTAIAIGEMANAGIQGSDAGTSLKTMLNNLIPMTQKQSDKFKELGLLTYDLKNAQKALFTETGVHGVDSIDGIKAALSEYVESLGKGNIGTWKNAKAVDDLLSKYGGLHNAFFDAKGDVKNLAGIQGALGKSLKGLTREQKLSTLETLFGADAMRASAIMSLEGRKGYDKFAEGVDKTKAADVAKVRLDNLAGAQEQLKGSLETAAIVIGSVFLPAITRLIQLVTSLVNVFLNLPAPVQKVAAILLLVSSAGLLVVGAFLALLPLIIGMVANFLLMRVVTTVTRSFFLFFKTLRAGQGIMAATTASSRLMGTTMATTGKRALFSGKLMLNAGKLIRLAWIAATGPIGLIVLAIAAVIAIAILLYKKWTPFRELVDAIGRAIKEKFLAAVEAMKPVLASALAALKQFGQFFISTILPVLKQVGQELLGHLLEAWKEISKAIMTDLMPALRQLGDGVQNDVLPALAKLWGVLQPIIMVILKVAAVIGGVLLKVLFELGKAFITYILPILIKVAGFLGGVLIDTLVMLITGVIDVITGVIRVFSGLIDFIAGVFTGDWSRAWEGIKEIFFGLVQLIIGIVKVYLAVGMLKIFGLLFKGLLKLVLLGWRGILAVFKGAGRGLWAAVKGIFRLIITIIKTYFRIWLTIAKGLWRGLKFLFQNGGSILRGLVVKIVKFIITNYARLGRAVWNLVKGLWSRVTNTTKSLLTQLANLIQRVLGNIVTFFTRLPGKILEALKGLADDLLQFGKDMIQGMVNGVKEAAHLLADAAKDAAKGALGAAAHAIGIGSPSKEFKYLGKMSMVGQIVGMEDEEHRVAASAAGIAKDMIGAYADVIKHTRPIATADMVWTATPDYSDTPRRRRSDREAAFHAVRGPRGGGASGNDAESSRLVSGWLRIDPSGRAWIEGIAEDVVEEQKNYEDKKRGPRGGPR